MHNAVNKIQTSLNRSIGTLKCDRFLADARWKMVEDMTLVEYPYKGMVGVRLTLPWYHGVNMTPGLFDRLNIPNFEIISFHLALYFLCRFLSTVSIHSILISKLPFL